MFTRRIGEACEAAQKLAGTRGSPSRPVTLMVRLDNERQKLFSAMQLSAVRHRL